MTELSRSLLTAAREGLAPDAAVAARVRAKVAAAVAAPVAATAVVGDAAAAVAPAKASLPIAKLGLALLVVAVATTTVVIVRSERAPAAPVVEMSAQEAAEPSANERSAVAEDPLVLPDAPRARAKQVATPNAPMPAASREPATLSREVELIDLAMVSLRKQAPLAAIEAIRVFERETLGRGQMAEDAAAIEIEARCVLGEDVTASLARFDRTWPESAQRERIQRTCFAK